MQAGLVADPNAFLRELNQHDPLLAAKCVVSGLVLDPDIHIVVARSLLDLLKEVRNSGERRSAECAQALRDLGVPSIVKDIMAIVNVGAMSIFKEEMMDIIVSYGFNAIPILVDFLTPSSSTGFFVAVSALGRIGDRRAIGALKQVLGTNLNYHQMVSVQSALVHLGDAESADIMMTLLTTQPDRTDNYFNSLHTDCLAWQEYIEPSNDHEHTMKFLLSIAQHQDLDQSSRQHVLRCLWLTAGKWKLMQNHRARILADAYTTADDELKVCIANILAELKEPDILPLLIDDIHSPIAALRQAVAAAIGSTQQQDRTFVDALISLLNDEDSYVRLPE